MANGKLSEPTIVVVTVVHDSHETGEKWKYFIQSLLTVDSTKEASDVYVEVSSICIDSLDTESSSDCNWKLFLLSNHLLEALNDSTSVLSTSDLLKSNPDRNIFLLLCSEDDEDFILYSKRNLEALFPEAKKYHVVQATEPKKIYRDIISIISPFKFILHPSVLTCTDTNQHITLIGNKPFQKLPSQNHFFKLVFYDDINGKESLHIKPKLFNCTTLLFQNRGHASGFYQAALFICTNDGANNDEEKIEIGQRVQAWYQSDLDNVHSIIERSCNPYQFLCQSFQISSLEDPHELIDNHLNNCFLRNVPDSDFFRLFGSKKEDEHPEDTCGQLVPTLLHFSAMYGLQNLTSTLLRTAGARRAFRSSNCDGDYPIHLAEKYGHWDLVEYMNNFMEVSEMVEAELSTDKQAATSDIVWRMTSGRSLSSEEEILLYGSTDNIKSFYTPMKSVDIIKELTPKEELGTTSTESSSESFYKGRKPKPLPIDTKVVDLNLSSDPHLSEDQDEDDTPPTPPPRSPIIPRRPAPLEESSLTGARVKSYRTINKEMLSVASNISPAQQQLINLQLLVKNKEITINQALLRFAEWETKNSSRAAMFQYQQERLKEVRDNLVRQKQEKGLASEITVSSPVIGGSSTYDMAPKHTFQQSGTIPDSIYSSAIKPSQKSDSGLLRKAKSVYKQKDFVGGFDQNISSQRPKYDQEDRYVTRPQASVPHTLPRY